MKKTGLSTVIASLLLVLLTITLVGIVWTVVNNIVTKELPEQGCIDIYEKVAFDNAYTCYNATTKEMIISISIADISIDKAIISVSGGGTSKNIEISNSPVRVNYLRPYNGIYLDNSKLPDKNSGLTYAYNVTAAGFSGMPSSIKITPAIGTEQCGVSSSIDEVYSC